MSSRWSEVTLGEVTTITNGGTPSTKNADYWGGEIVWITTTELTEYDGKRVNFSKRRITQDGLISGPARMVRAGTTLVGTTATIGTCAMASCDLAFNQQISGLTSKTNNLDDAFLFYWIQYAKPMIESLAAGTSFKRISTSVLKTIPINCPPISEQKRIVDLISSIDSYIEALQHQLVSAKKSRNAVLHELLTPGGDDWIETTLGQEFEICKNGKNYKDGISTAGLPISRIQTIASGKIDLKKVGFGNLFLEDAEGFLLEEGDILFSHINSLPHVGKVAIVQSNHLPLIHGMNLLRMRFTNSNDTKFMFYLMQSESMRDEIKSRAQVAVNQVSINISNIKTIKIVIPPLRTQREIASLMDAWENLIEECENNLNSSQQLRVGLLSELLSGEHEIPASYDKVMGAAS